MRRPRWLRPVHDLPSRNQLKERTAAAEDLAARGDQAGDVSRRLRSQNSLGAIVEKALGLRNGEGHEA